MTNKEYWLHKAILKEESEVPNKVNKINITEHITDLIGDITDSPTTGKVSIAGDTMTGLLSLPQIKIGSNNLPINNVVSTVTNDNTKLPTSKAVYDFVGDLSYSNSTPVPEDVGGVEVGDTFNDVSLTEMFNKILYPYQYPAFTSFYLNSFQAARYEIGTSISGSQVFNWTTSNSSNINSSSIEILGANITTLSGQINDGTQSITFNTPLTRTTAGSETWTIRGTNSKSQVFNTTTTVRWDFKLYFGSSSNTSLTEAQIKALQNNQLTAGNNGTKGTFTFDASNYKYFVFANDSSYAKPSSFVDSATGFAVGMYGGYSNTQNGYSYDLVNVTNNGVTQAYRVYRTQNMLSNSLTIIIN